MREQRPNSGALFKNDRKTQDSHPDYSGSINVAGIDYWLNGYLKEGSKGKFFSLTVKPKLPKVASHPEPTRDEYEDSIPF